MKLAGLSTFIEKTVPSNYHVPYQVLQLVLQEEVSPDSSSAKRSQTTGHLVVTMPKARQTLRAKKPNTQQPTHKPQKTDKDEQQFRKQEKADTRNEQTTVSKMATSTEVLEVDPSVRKGADFANIVKDRESDPGSRFKTKASQNQGVANKPRVVSEDFVDDPDVPPLI